MRSASETVIEAPIPRAEVPGWRTKYGVVAGITRKPYDLGLWTRDATEDVMKRWREFRRSEPGFTQYVLGHQVHGTRIEIHGEVSRGRRAADRTGGRRMSDGGEGGGEWRVFEGVDGHVAAGTGTMLCVTVADCTPVYLLHPATKMVALLHAGWRGTAAGVLERGVQSLLVAATGIPGDPGIAGVVCHLGVSICGPCYEVGPEVFEAMSPWANEQKPTADGRQPTADSPQPAGGKGFLDVRRVLVKQAESLGIKEITVSGHCSKHGEGWYSHRGGDPGRMVAYCGVPA